MSGIPLSSGFNLSAQQALDARSIVDTIANRDLIPSIQRYVGMEVFCLADKKKYILKNGVTNTDWEEFSSGGANVNEVYIGDTEPSDNNIKLWIYDDGQPDTSHTVGTLPKILMSATTATIEPNKFYEWGEVSILTITLGTPTDTTIVAEYSFQFTSGNLATTLTNITGVTWYGGTPTVLANKKYQVSIINGIGLIVGV